jgi:HEAT repeat protein
MVETRLGWKKACKHADAIVSDGNLSREQHIQVFKKFLESRNDQDHRIAIALLRSFIAGYPEDFDSDLTLDHLIEYGNKLCRGHYKDYGREVLFAVMKERQVPAVWIDKIADEESKNLRHAFALALIGMAKRKRIPIERTLGFFRYFLDEPSTEVRESLVKALKIIGERDSQKLFYFLVGHEEGAGSSRMALINATREIMHWELRNLKDQQDQQDQQDRS